jgi:hypothetical protein
MQLFNKHKYKFKNYIWLWLCLLGMQVAQAQQPTGNRGMYFDGVDDYVNVATSLFSTDFTIGFWIKTNKTGGVISTMNRQWQNGHALIDADAAGGDNDWGISLANGKILFGVGQTSGSDFTAESSIVISDNKWHHIAVTRNATTGAMDIYIDGNKDTGTIIYQWNGSTLSTTSSVIIGAINTTFFRIAQSTSSSLSLFNGQLDEIKIFDKDRSSTQIAYDMSSTNPTDANLIAYWDFEEGTGQGAIDESTNSFVGRLGTTANVDNNDPLWALRVTNTLDDGSQGSLRWAITQANTDTDTDYIDFSIQQDGSTSTITLSSVLPDISESVVIDGYSAFGASENTFALAQGNNATLRVEINCQNLPTTTMLTINGAGSVIKGLSAYGYNLSSGTRPFYFHLNAFNSQLIGNYIGLRANSSSTPEYSKGAYLGMFTSNHIISGNVIANQYLGIENYSTGSLIKNNLLGTSPTGWTNIANTFNIVDGGGPNGGVNLTIQDNVLANSSGGMELNGAGVVVKGNYVGTDPSKTNDLGGNDYGIVISGTNSIIGGIDASDGNVIANNDLYGIMVQTNIGNKISGNQIYGNTLGGIKLQNGGNAEKDAPEINIATPTQISGACTTCADGEVIEVFENNPGENQGRAYKGQTTVLSDGSWTYSDDFMEGNQVTATATDANNNTSAFGNEVVVESPTITNNALDFDGTDNYVSVPNASALIAKQSAFTMEGWVKPGNPVGFPDVDTFFGFRNNSDANFYLAHINETGIEARLTTNENTFTIQANTVTPNVWQHFALVYNGSQLLLYKNGGLIQSIVASGQILNTTTPFEIGKSVFGSEQFFLDGQIDEVRIWNTARSCEQIKDGMNCQIDPMTVSGLVAYYDFNENSGTILFDRVGSSDGTLTSFNFLGTSSDWVASNPNISMTACTFMGTYPEIDLVDDQSNPILAGSIVDFGTVTTGTTVSFTIRNNGSADLNLTNIISEQGTGFTLSNLPTLGNIAPKESITFSVQVSASEVNTYQGAILIFSNDCDEPTYTFDVSAVVQATGEINAPTNLYVSVIPLVDNTKHVSISWTDNADNETHYVIERKAGSTGTFEVIATLDPDSFSYNDESILSGGITYFYRVKAIAGSSASEYSEVRGVVVDDIYTAIEPNSLDLHTQIFPNPSDGKFVIQIENDYIGALEFVLMDVYGKVVSQWKQDKKEKNIENRIDFVTEKQGMYYLLIKNNETSIVRKIIKNQ